MLQSGVTVLLLQSTCVDMVSAATVYADAAETQLLHVLSSLHGDITTACALQFAW